MKFQRPFVAALCLACVSAGAAPANLLLNSSFEYETAADFHACVYWALNRPGTHGDSYGSAQRENWRAHDGFYAMAIRGAWAGAGDGGGVWQEVPAVPGTDYRFTAWAWADAAWTAQTRGLKIEFWDADHSRRIATAAQPLEGVGESWQEVALAAVAPAEAVWVRAVVHVAGAGPEGALLVDALALRAGTAP